MDPGNFYTLSGHNIPTCLQVSTPRQLSSFTCQMQKQNAIDSSEDMIYIYCACDPFDRRKTCRVEICMDVPHKRKAKQYRIHTTVGIRWWSPTQLLIHRFK